MSARAGGLPRPVHGIPASRCVHRVRRVVRSGRIAEVGCWAHARRRFVEALDTEVTAAPVLALIQQLYQVEHDAAALAPDARRALRQARAVPLLAQLDTQRRALAAQVLPSRRWARLCGTWTGNGAHCSGTSPTAVCSSTTTMPNGSCGRSPWAGRTGCLQEPRRRASRSPALLAAPELSVDRCAAVPVPARRVAAGRLASTGPDSPTDPEGLVRNLRRLIPAEPPRRAATVKHALHRTDTILPNSRSDCPSYRPG